MNVFGYVRVSSTDQNEDRQLLVMQEKQVPEGMIFLDKQSGKSFDRPRYQEMIHMMKKGDLLYVLSIDRLGRNYEEIQQQWRLITKDIGADICVIDMPLLDTRQSKDLLGTFVADLVLQVLSFAAHNERDNIRKRQAEGIAAARRRGVHLGRPAMEPTETFPDLVRQWEKKEITMDKIRKETGMSESTFYRRRREMNMVKKGKK